MATAVHAEKRHSAPWSARSRLVFSVVVIASWAVMVVVYECFTPWWAGDHIGFSLGAIALYAVNGLIWVAAANLAYGLGRTVEKVAKPVDVATYRRRAHALLVTLGAASSVIWFGARVIAGWIEHG